MILKDVNIFLQIKQHFMKFFIDTADLAQIKEANDLMGSRQTVPWYFRPGRLFWPPKPAPITYRLLSGVSMTPVGMG
jgi:hypothetical protein